MIMMITLAKRCLEDGEFPLSESVLNVIKILIVLTVNFQTSISMSVISEDLILINKHKAKSLSKDFIQRYLNSLSDFIKVDQSFADEQRLGYDFTCQEFSIWKFLLINLDRKNNEALAVVFAFIQHISLLIQNANYTSKAQESRMRLLLHFILCSFATTLNLTNICEALSITKSHVDS